MVCFYNLFNLLMKLSVEKIALFGKFWSACRLVRLANVCNVGRLLKNKKCVSAKNKTLSGRLVWSAVLPFSLTFLSLYVVLSIFMSLSFFLGLLVTVTYMKRLAFRSTFLSSYKYF